MVYVPTDDASSWFYRAKPGSLFWSSINLIEQRELDLIFAHDKERCTVVDVCVFDLVMPRTQEMISAIQIEPNRMAKYNPTSLVVAYI